MTRPLRIIDPDFVYHVTSRGVDRREIVRDDSDRQALVRLMGSTVEEMEWILHSWVLMSNHLHLVVRAPRSNLSQGMQRFLGAYAARFNKSTNRIGHLFQRRFHAKPIKDDAHLLQVVRYVPLNPVRAGLVRGPALWRWSSYRATAGLEPAPPWLEINWTLAQFHPADAEQARQRFREFVACVPLEAVERLIRIFDAAELQRRGHPARKAFVHLAHDECGLGFDAIACRLGITRPGAAKLYATSQVLLATDAEYQEALTSYRRKFQKGSDPF